MNMNSQQNRSSSLKKREDIENQQHREVQSPKKQTSKQVKRKSIILGICAKRKKVESKPMKQILKRMACPEIQILQMWGHLDKPYKQWPVVDALICFYSQGFPYLKAWKYVKKFKPFLISNLDKQQYLWDRTVVYDILKKIRIPVAKHYMIFKDLNYIQEIQDKAFYAEGQRQTLVRGDSELPQTPKFEPVDAEQKCSKLQNLNIDNSYSLGQLQVDKQFLQKQERKSTNRKQTFDLSGLNLNMQRDKTEKQQKASEQYKQPLTAQIAKRSINRQIASESRPSTLRRFHQERLNRIEHYEIQQKDDQLLIKCGEKINKLKKPFVQKPFDAQNHQICIYYPQSMGGGRKMLFRKVKNSSSTYEPNQNRIRRDGNYIYQEYLPNNAFDIKVYTIGEFYMYAEARKSPTLDGVVQRDQLGKQKRFPIILTPEQKFIAKKIVQQFGQFVCGFDLLRANGKSYVCDVNGWSFVKGNPKYWTDCAKILQKMIFNKFFPHLIKEQSKYLQRFNTPSQNSFRPPLGYSSTYKQQQLRSIVSVFRHADRSPKLKLKFKTSEKKFIQFFTNHKQDQIKIKDANSLTKLLEVTLQVIGDNPNMKSGDLAKLGQMKTVLQSGGHFEGLNRKCQLKVISRDEQQKINKILIVFKWGGQLSTKGFNDAFQLGKKMRMEKYNDDQDFLSLHSSYRHDLKTYSSDEGRCIKTAAAFLKGFLNIQGGLAPIITSMVMANKKAQNLLDCTSEQNHSQLSEKIVKKLSDMLNNGEELAEIYEKAVDQKQISPQMLRILKQIGNSRQKLKTLHKWIVQLTLLLQNQKLSEFFTDSDSGARFSGISGDDDQLGSNSSKKQDIVLIYQRWSKLQKDFYIQDQMRFNISKIPQIYDTIRHDLSKNSHVFANLQFDSQGFMQLAKVFAYFVVSNQYGITNEQKIKTAQQIASPLLDKILVDLLFWKDKQYEDQYWKYQNNGGGGEDWKHIRTRLYFTSASHIYSLLHLLTLGNDSQLIKSTPPEQADKISRFVYMSYLSHIQFRLYENLQMKPEDPNRFRVQLSIYPDFSKGSSIEEGTLGKNGFTIDQIQKFITNVTTSIKNKDRIYMVSDFDEMQRKLNGETQAYTDQKIQYKKIKKQKSHSNHKVKKSKKGSDDD